MATLRVSCVLWLSAALVAVSLFFKCGFLNTERSLQQICTKPVFDSFTRLIEALLRAQGKVFDNCIVFNEANYSRRRQISIQRQITTICRAILNFERLSNESSMKHIDDCFMGLTAAVFHRERKDFCSYTVLNGVGNESLIQKEQFLFLTNTILESRRFENHDRICISEVLQASKEVSIVPYFNNNNNSVCSASSLLTGRQWCKLPSIKFKVSKSKYAKSRVTYYSNSVASYRLLLIAGDVHPQPGPSAAEKTRVKKTTVKCPQCEKIVKRNHKRSNSWFIKNAGAHDPRSWTCPECTLSELPFFNVKDLEILERKGNEQINSTLDSELETLDFIAEALRNHPKHLSIMHLNTQSMVSSFNEFQTLVSDCPMDIITMSETWIKENPALLDYVALSGYTAIFNSRDTRFAAAEWVHVLVILSISSAGKILKIYKLTLKICGSKSLGGTNIVRP
ncbi:Hypothetical predicted protein [Paramuricea clavata]|uniref:Uncharacterized protein n=1 Tax=Paramuricea clavata TaxID=317549 RepID=A0A6S7K0A6_PARCT|nr:Hypothetical predicted protein [Paramuricea clavata]